jgi:hypothetical protein
MTIIETGRQQGSGTLVNATRRPRTEIGILSMQLHLVIQSGLAWTTRNCGTSQSAFPLNPR